MTQKFITFKYNGKIYKAQHLKNKLKKLKCTEADIEILPEEINPNNVLTHPDYAYFFNIHTYETILILLHDMVRPDINVELKSLCWDENTQTGLRNFNINEWVLLEGKPKYPIQLGINRMPELECVYEWQ